MGNLDLLKSVTAEQLNAGVTTSERKQRFSIDKATAEQRETLAKILVFNKNAMTQAKAKTPAVFLTINPEPEKSVSVAVGMTATYTHENAEKTAKISGMEFPNSSKYFTLKEGGAKFYVSIPRCVMDNGDKVSAFRIVSTK